MSDILKCEYHAIIKFLTLQKQPANNIHKCFGQSLWGECPVVYLCRHLKKHLRHFVELCSTMIMRSNRPLSLIWGAYHMNSIWLASKSFLIDITNILLLRAIMLKNKTKILFVLFVRHIELQNFLIALVLLFMAKWTGWGCVFINLLSRIFFLNFILRFGTFWRISTTSNNTLIKQLALKWRS